MAKKSPEIVKEEARLRAQIAARIRGVRKQKGYASYEVFAYESNISRSQIFRYENGKGDMRVITLLKIIKALGMSPAEFFSPEFDWS
jgi:transcriptional regulator with XRE-family HTH domain